MLLQDTSPSNGGMGIGHSTPRVGRTGCMKGGREGVGLVWGEGREWGLYEGRDCVRKGEMMGCVCEVIYRKGLEYICMCKRTKRNFGDGVCSRALFTHPFQLSLHVVEFSHPSPRQWPHLGAVVLAGQHRSGHQLQPHPPNTQEAKQNDMMVKTKVCMHAVHTYTVHK